MRSDVANVLGISPSALELCYTFSFDRTAKSYRQLTNADHWDILISDARNYRNKATTVRHNLKDSWSIQLKEQRDLLVSGNTNGNRV
jgi:hypothetical protein